MIPRILHARRLLACLVSAATRMALYFRTPFPEDNIFLRVMAIRSELLHPLPRYNALHRLFDPAFRHLHFRPQGKPQDSGRQTASLS
jgi:hypothetical protein